MVLLKFKARDLLGRSGLTQVTIRSAHTVGIVDTVQFPVPTVVSHPTGEFSLDLKPLVPYDIAVLQGHWKNTYRVVCPNQPEVLLSDLLASTPVPSTNAEYLALLDRLKADLGQAVSGVSSVNGETGAVILSAQDVGASPENHSHSGYSLNGHSHPYSPLGHNHDLAYAPLEHIHSAYSLTGHNHNSLYSLIDHNHDGRYSLSGHSHVITDVTGLETALDGKASTSHNHDSSYSAANHDHSLLYAPINHGHIITDITGLQSALDGKSNTGHTHGVASGSAAGFMSSTDKTKLDGLPSSINYPVTSVNGKTGEAVLTAADVGAIPVPTVAGENTVAIVTIPAGSSIGVTTNSFVQVPLNTVVRNPGNHYNSGTRLYTCPTDGYYLCLAKFRLSDNHNPSSYGVGVNTSRVDFAGFQWYYTAPSGSTPPGRNGAIYFRMDYFTAGSQLQFYYYVNPGTSGNTISSAELTIFRLW